MTSSSSSWRVPALADAYATACAAYAEWECVPRWRARRKARLRAEAERLADVADAYRFPLLDRHRGLTAAPLIVILDAARAASSRV